MLESIHQSWQRLRVSKTFWTSLGAFVTALGAYLAGDLGILELIAAGFAVAIVVFGRDAQGKAIEAAVVAAVAAREARVESIKTRIDVDKLQEAR